MIHILVCIKQVPMVSELPWDAKTGTLKRELAQGMMDPAGARALEAALRIKEKRGAYICALTMGPPMAEEVLHQAKALGADEGILLTDRKMAGADTFLTSHILSRFVCRSDRRFDLILCGSQASDSETAQVGPQLAEELNIPSVCYAGKVDVADGLIRIERHVDDFFESLEMSSPGLVTVDLDAYVPRYLPLSGVQDAFESSDVRIVDAEKLGLEKKFNALKDSPTRIIDVYSPVAQKENTIIKGAVKKIVDRLFTEYGKQISGAMGKDLKTHDHDMI